MSSPIAHGFSYQDLSRLSGLERRQVLAYVKAEVITPSVDERGEASFSFQDLVLLRTAKSLVQQAVSPHRVKRALRRLREELAETSGLTSVRLEASGSGVVAWDGEEVWNPESGQRLFGFNSSLSTPSARAAPRCEAPAASTDAGSQHTATTEGAQQWFEEGAELEASDRAAAIRRYQQALALEPGHVDAHLNLGRCLHESGDPKAALDHYRAAAQADPADSTAAFNLGVAFEDLGQPDEALKAYEKAVDLDDQNPDAYYNLARLYELRGDRGGALRCLVRYRALSSHQS